jgi:ATP-dependent DNA helicase Rep
VLQLECAKVGLRRGFSIFDSDDTLALVKELLPAGLKPDALESWRSLVSRAKNEGLDPEQALAQAQSTREQEAADSTCATSADCRRSTPLTSTI